jgi:hypothetical protein
LIRAISTLGFVAILAITACSEPASRPSPTDPPEVTTTTIVATTTTTVETPPAIRRYESCLAENGIEIEPIPFDAAGRPRLELVMRDIDFFDPSSAAALTKCAEHLAIGPLDLSGDPILRERMNVLLGEFSNCMRDHGVPDFPDPIPGFSGIGSPYPPAEIPYSDPKLESAVEGCAERLR